MVQVGKSERRGKREKKKEGKRVCVTCQSLFLIERPLAASLPSTTMPSRASSTQDHSQDVQQKKKAPHLHACFRISPRRVPPPVATPGPADRRGRRRPCVNQKLVDELKVLREWRMLQHGSYVGPLALSSGTRTHDDEQARRSRRCRTPLPYQPSSAHPG